MRWFKPAGAAAIFLVPNVWLQRRRSALPRSLAAGLSAKAGNDTPTDARADTSPELAAAVAQIRAASPRPNIVFIVLESVGAQQLLGNLADTPNIAHSAIIFDHVYAVYPSTARNHLAINTGGFHITGDDMIEMRWMKWSAAPRGGRSTTLAAI